MYYSVEGPSLRCTLYVAWVLSSQEIVFERMSSVLSYIIIIYTIENICSLLQIIYAFFWFCFVLFFVVFFLFVLFF